MTRLSIVVPTLDRGDVLNHALASLTPEVQGCLFDDYEVIVVDGGSRDETSKVLRAFSTQLPMRVLERPPHGVYDAINAGVDAAGGSHFTWVNSDDRLGRGSLSALLSTLDVHPDCEVVSGLAQVKTWPDGHVAHKFGHSWTSSLSHVAICFGHPIPNARVYATRLVKDVGPFDSSLKIAADRDWLLRLVERGVTEVLVPNYVYEYWQHPTSLTFSGARAIPKQRQEYVQVGRIHGGSFAAGSPGRIAARAWSSWHDTLHDHQADRVDSSELLRRFPRLFTAASLKSLVRAADRLSHPR